jgi:ankyrin repeat protein
LYTLPKPENDEFIVTAIKSGSRELVDELLHQGNVLPTRAEIHQEILRDLVAYDREEMFIWLTQTQGWSFSPKEWGYLYDRIIVAALRTGNFQRLQRVIRMGYPLQNLSHKAVFLIYAAHNGNLQAVQWLAKQGVPVQPTEAQYYRLEYADNHKLGIEPYSLVSATKYTFVNLRPTALEEAEAHGHLDIAQWLIQQGAKPLAHLIKAEITSEHPLDKKQVALCRSVQCQVYNYQSKSAAEKIRRIPYVILDDQIGEYLSLTDSPLAIAIQAEHLPLAKYILLHYPEKIHEKPGGYSFLHKAVVLHSTALVKYLLEQGADPLALDPYGRTPLDYSIDLHHQPIYNLLRNAEIKALANKKGGYAPKLP